MENIKIKEIPINERPRERLINLGAENLSDEELLSIILKTGTKNMSVKNLSAYILSKIGGIEKLKDLNIQTLEKINGIGEAKACTILALIEISKRMNRKFPTLIGMKLNTPVKVMHYYQNKINNFQEQVYCIYLDNVKKVIKEKLLFLGTANHSLVHPRDIFKEAYLLNATSIICVHNHPSGEVTPSKEDIEMTNRIKDIGKLMGIPLLDHIIIGDNKYYSFLENGKI